MAKGVNKSFSPDLLIYSKIFTKILKPIRFLIVFVVE